MRTMVRSKITLLFMALGMLIAIPSIAFADNVIDNLNGANETKTITSGGSTTNTYWIQQANNDPNNTFNGCNVSATSPAYVKLVGPDGTSLPSGVTATYPNRDNNTATTETDMEFTACGTNASSTAAKQVSFSSSTPGVYNLQAKVTSGPGAYDTSNANFTLVVCAAADASGSSTDLFCTGAPTAEAGGPSYGPVNEGSSIQLDGSGSTDDGLLTYAWDLDNDGQYDDSAAQKPNYTAPQVDADTTFTVGLRVTDNEGQTATDTATVSVKNVANTKPTLSLPANITGVEATGPNGAPVTFSVSASDTEDGTLTPSCTRGNPATSVASGDTFALGTTTVNCSVTDSGGLSDSGSFTVTVQDTTAPVIAAHANVTAEATGPGGALVTYTSPSTSDAVDGNGTATCLPLSGSQFALGETTVTCNATDAAGNAATATTFKVNVVDTTAPVISGVPADISQTANTASGREINYTNPTASDAVSGTVTVNCSPVSGSLFPLGLTTVNCSATDGAGNTANASFKVNVTVSATSFLQPINMEGDSIFKQGSTVPVKFQLTGDSAGITNAVANLRIAKVSNNVLGDELEALTSTPASTGSLFRYDATSGQYIYNWGTKSYTAGTYQLRIDLGDGVTRTVLISLKK